MRNRLSLAITLIAALFLAGCVTIRVDTKINSNLSGERSMIIAMDDSTIEMMKSSTTPEPGKENEEVNPFDSFKKDASNLPPNAKVEDYHDDFNKQTGVKITVPFANLDELVSLSKTGTFSGTDEIEIQRSGETVTMRMKMQTQNLTSEMSSGAALTTPESGEPQPTVDPEMAKQMASMFDFTYSVAPAGEIVSYSPKDGAKLDSATNTVTWKVDLASEDALQYEITWKPGGAPAAQKTEQPAAEKTPAAPAGAQTTPVVAATPSPKSALPGPCAGCLPGIVLPLGGAGLAGLLGKKRFRL